MVLGVNGLGLGDGDRTPMGNPIPRPGEVWELYHEGYERWHFRIERFVGYSVVGQVEWFEGGSWPGHVQQQIFFSAQWDNLHPRRVEPPPEI